MEASKKHIIPVYGLLEDYENIVKVESSVESQEYVFKTEKSNIDKLCLRGFAKAVISQFFLNGHFLNILNQK